MRSFCFSLSPCHRCGGEDGCHGAGCVPFLSFGNSTLRFEKLIARIVAKRVVIPIELRRAA